MKRLISPKAGDAGILTVEEVADPCPRSGEVVVKVEAAGLNFADVLARQGLYPDAPPFPHCMGYEFAGVVSATGNAATAPCAPPAGWEPSASPPPANRG